MKHIIKRSRVVSAALNHQGLDQNHKQISGAWAKSKAPFVKIEHNGNTIHILNAPSPTATASLAIGTEVQKMANEYFNLSRLFYFRDH